MLPKGGKVGVTVGLGVGLGSEVEVGSGVWVGEGVDVGKGASGVQAGISPKAMIEIRHNTQMDDLCFQGLNIVVSDPFRPGGMSILFMLELLCPLVFFFG